MVLLEVAEMKGQFGFKALLLVLLLILAVALMIFINSLPFVGDQKTLLFLGLIIMVAFFGLFAYYY